MSDETPARIEPGDRFEVGYGNGRKIEVVALSVREQKKLATVCQQLVEAEGSSAGFEVFDLAEQALRLAKPDITDEQLEKIDAEAATAIALRTLTKQKLSEDEEKK